jgi:hypothetical protein
MLAQYFTKNFAPVKRGYVQGTRPGKDPWLYPPPTWTGTLPEWAVYWGHLQLGLKDGQDFEYQFKFSLAPNGVDFFEIDIQVGIEMNGLYWHYGFGAAKQDSDLERRIRIEAFGIQMIVIDEDDALRDPIFYVREARLGRDHSRATMGGI